VAEPLVTLANAKNYIRPDSSEDDDTLAYFVRVASSVIRDFTQRLFTKPPVTEQRTVNFSGTRSVRLDDPLKDVTQIIAPIVHLVEGEPYPFVEILEPTAYELQQFPNGTTLRFESPAYGNYEITGTWGWETIPGTIEHATNVTIDEWYRGNTLPSTASRAEGEAESKNLYLPREVQEMLHPWALTEVVA
jgi:hypothetical protein